MTTFTATAHTGRTATFPTADEALDWGHRILPMREQLRARIAITLENSDCGWNRGDRSIFISRVSI